jgi:hypothetical protein
MTNRTAASLFLDFSRMKLLEQYWPRMKKAVESLTDEQVWWRPNDASNSIGNLTLHLNGNMTQWIVASFNRQPDARNRPAEFAACGSNNDAMGAADLIARLGATVERAGETLARLTEADLLATYEIQGFTVSGLQAVYQVIEHFALHYGQVLYITKQVQGRDLGFTNQLDKTGRAIAPDKKP